MHSSLLMAQQSTMKTPAIQSGAAKRSNYHFYSNLIRHYPPLPLPSFTHTPVTMAMCFIRSYVFQIKRIKLSKFDFKYGQSCHFSKTYLYQRHIQQHQQHSLINIFLISLESYNGSISCGVFAIFTKFYLDEQQLALPDSSF